MVLMSVTKPRVLVVDDEEDIRLVARLTLESHGFEVVGEARNGAEAVARLVGATSSPLPDVVLLDNRMPGLTGLEAAERILARHPDQRIVLFTGDLTHEVERRARDLGVAACVVKTDILELPTVLRAVLE